MIIIETEIWPNLFSHAKQTGARLAIVNGRISERTWPRYRLARSFFEPIVRLPDLVFVQSGADRDRYASLGVLPAKLRVEANLKYDASASRSPIPIETFGAEQVWIAASTVGPNERGSLKRHSIDEDDIVLHTFQALARIFPRLLLIVAPRQPARFAAVARKLERDGVRFLRRTGMGTTGSLALELPGVLLLDTIGELSRIYPAADVVFVGGSIAPRGGHNVIEPGSAGAPIVIGPHMHNFETVAADFLQSNALVQIDSHTELFSTIRDLLIDRARAHALGRNARQLVQRRRGVSERLSQSLLPLYHEASLKPDRGPLARFSLGVLAAAWRRGGVFKARGDQRHANAFTPLGVPVISIGGITIGGSGKTPFTVYLASQLAERGFEPAILTRGYRRRSPAKSLILNAGAKASAAITGDEAQIFLRAGIAPIGIGADRYETGQLLLSRFPCTNVLLLDDGFQHTRLKRDIDIVLIDGLDPFGQENVVPAGRLREPLTALGRADMFIVTRVEDDSRFRAICTRLRDFKPTAPIFRTRLMARRWHDYRTGLMLPGIEARRVGAFCGLGNPETFWRTLDSLGFDVVFRWAFDDHHTYKPFELQRVAYHARESGAELLVTTEKDRINCPPQLKAAITPLELAWLEIETEVEEEATFFAYIEQALRRRAVA